MTLVKDSIAALEISDELKADIMQLFGEIDAKETEVENLRKKVPTDSQKVVESVDFAKFEQATKELEMLKSDLSKKIETGTTPEESEGILSAFSQFFA